MKKTIIGLFSTLVLFYANMAFAHDHHTANFCSKDNAKLCAHLGFNQLPNTTDEFQFVTHFMLKSGLNYTLLSDVAVELQDANSNIKFSGTEVVQSNASHFEVTKAFFSNSGNWLINVYFKYDNQAYIITIPLDVN